MTDTIACDVSYFQAAVDDSYPHPWLIMRACDGTFRDPHFPANRAWAEQACEAGQLAGYTAYVVYRPGVDVVGVLKSMVGTPGPHLTVMFDVESWGGQVGGDQSQEITQRVKQAATWLGNEKRVIAYGNQGDLASIYPHRPAGLRLIVAAYSSVAPRVPGMIGWQYSDGQAKWPTPAGLPRSSPPFGACDHNVFGGLTPAKLAAALGVGAVKKEADLSAKEVQQINDHTDAAVKALQADLDRLFTGSDQAKHKLPVWLRMFGGTPKASRAKRATKETKK